ncbi:hypothetical protein PZH30_22940, partial [Escherichia coli]|nr:hypothetical protein [Escherichia coli]
MSGLRPALSTFIFLLLITGGVYPLLTTVLGQSVVSHLAASAGLSLMYGCGIRLWKTGARCD